MRRRLAFLALALGLALGLAELAAAQSCPNCGPAARPGVSIRQYEIPQPPLIIERPPRIFQEITQTVEVTPRPARLEVLELAAPSRLELAPSWPDYGGRRIEATRFGVLGGVHHFNRDGGRLEILHMGPLGGVRYFSRDR